MSKNAARVWRRVRNMMSQTQLRLYYDIACNMHYNYEFLIIVMKEKLLVENI